MDVVDNLGSQKDSFGRKDRRLRTLKLAVLFIFLNLEVTFEFDEAETIAKQRGAVRHTIAVNNPAKGETLVGDLLVA
jgi:hypothetical protein